ncbi:MAG: TonB C-terminal domain-containing protein, partial [Gemmatimonadaceae bacterium]
PALPVPPRSSAAMPMPNAPRRPPTPAATPTLPRAEPLPARADPPTAARAGGGDVGDRGADVATVRTEGIEFPYPGYLENIVRQIALRFDPPKNAGGVRAEIKFLIRRDGSATIVQFVTRSGVFAFDQEAQAAIEAAANARAFGPLPDRFADDALPVIFSFDPRTIR